ncbi:MAG TPA: hypothetical protein VFJ97_10430 [Dermatophilaceae bacterium]|nr:hypothetical protein [Dermatophilaceae bacterium]
MVDLAKTRRYAAPAGLVAAGVLAGAIVATTSSAGAADGTTPSPAVTAQPGVAAQRPQETPLTGTTAAKVRAAVLAKYPGATIERLETDSDGVYEAHIRTKAGDRLTVEVDKAFAVTGQESRPAGGRGGPGGFGFGHGPGGFQHEQLTGDASTKAKAAVLAKYPGAAVLHMWKEADGTYRAFVTTSDGKALLVTLDSAFKVTGAQEGRTRGHFGGHGDRHDTTPNTPAPSTTPTPSPTPTRS